MNYGTFKSRLLLACGHMKATHPLAAVTNGGGDFVNAGVKFMILRASQKYPNFELFPEHKDVEWTDITIVDQNYLILPNDAMAVQRAFSLDSATSPNLNNTNWRELSYTEPRAFDLLSKTTSTVQYPAQWTIREGRIYFNPTPRTTKTTYVKIDGIQDEPDMSSSTDSPRMHARWHSAILHASTYLMMSDLGWHDDAAKHLALADEEITSVAVPLIGMKRQNIRRQVRVGGAPKGMF